MTEGTLNELDKPQKSVVKDHGVAASPVASHPTHHADNLDDRLDVRKHVAATVLPTEVKNGEEMDFNKTSIAALLKKNSSKVRMSVGKSSYMLRPTVRVFYTGAGPDLVCTSSLQGSNWVIPSAPSTTCLSCLPQPLSKRHRQSYAFCSAGRSLRMRLFWCQWQSRCTAANLSFVHRQFCDKNIPHERWIVPILSPLVAIISHYTPLSNLLAVVQNA